MDLGARPRGLKWGTKSSSQGFKSACHGVDVRQLIRCVCIAVNALMVKD